MKTQTQINLFDLPNNSSSLFPQKQSVQLFSELSTTPSTPSNSLFDDLSIFQSGSTTMDSEQTSGFINEPLGEWPQWTIEKSPPDSLMDIEAPMTDQESQQYLAHQEKLKAEKEKKHNKEVQRNQQMPRPQFTFNRGLDYPLQSNNFSYHQNRYLGGNPFANSAPSGNKTSIFSNSNQNPFGNTKPSPTQNPFSNLSNSGNRPSVFSKANTNIFGNQTPSQNDQLKNTKIKKPSQVFYSRSFGHPIYQ